VRGLTSSYVTFSPFFHLGSFWTVAVALRTAAETENVRVGSCEEAARWRGAQEVGRSVDMAEVRRAVAVVRLKAETAWRERADMAGD
jgi:hypothetical protein